MLDFNEDDAVDVTTEFVPFTCDDLAEILDAHTGRIIARLAEFGLTPNQIQQVGDMINADSNATFYHVRDRVTHPFRLGFARYVLKHPPAPI